MLNIENIIITSKILKAIAEFDEFKGCWEVIESLPPDRLTILNVLLSSRALGRQNSH